MKKPYLAESLASYPGYGIKKGDTVLILGEVDQMPGHLVVVNKTGKRTISGLHAECFRKLTEDEA